MGAGDVLWMIAIVGGAAYLLYRSVWKGKGRCQGCSNLGCSRRALAVPGALLGCLLAPAAPLRAAAPVVPFDVASPMRSEAEIYHTPVEKTTAGRGSRVTTQIAISGLLEVEASFDDSGSGLTLATAQLSLDVKIDEHRGGTLVLLAEDGGAPAVDEATIDLAAGRWSARAGLQLLPFGRFNSHFISDPLTLELGETKETALLVGLAVEPFALSAFVFGGDARGYGDEERIEDWGAALTAAPAEGIEFGVSCLSDLADGGAGLFADAGNVYRERVAGWSAFAAAALGPVKLSAEVLGALERFAAADGGGRPEAWNVEVAYDPAKRVEVAIRHEWGRDLPGGVERRLGAVASWSPMEQVSLAAELLRAGSEYAFSARLALEF